MEPAEKPDSKSIAYCQNCGSEGRGVYCHQCGQRYASNMMPLRNLLAEAIDTFLNLDNRL